MTNSQIEPNYIERQAKLCQLIKDTAIQCIALAPSPGLIYFTGLDYHLFERPIVVIIKPDHPVTAIIPELEKGKTLGVPFQIQCFTYPEEPETWINAFSSAFSAIDLPSGATLGVEPASLRYLEYSYLSAARPDIQFTSAENILNKLRTCKAPEEISAIREAVVIAKNALKNTLALFKLEMTERDLAAELSLQLFRAGSDSEAAFAPIVASGVNSANPHAVPGEKQIHAGDLLVIDWGARYHGYISDLTRTFAVGDIDPQLIHIAQIVARANAAGRAASKPGIAAEAVDAAARNVIDKAGYGQYFFHRTGHGIGLEAHEEPYIRAGNKNKLVPGMTYTIEPGIYLPGKGGVRIEDNVVITAQGAECLSDLERELVRIG